MNVRDLVVAKLKEMGAAGLCTDGCGCGLDDLMPCCISEDTLGCEPARIASEEEADAYRCSDFPDIIYIPLEEKT